MSRRYGHIGLFPSSVHADKPYRDGPCIWCPQALNTSACTASEKPVIDVLVRRGLVHGFTFYLLWSPIIAAGIYTIYTSDNNIYIR
jgi:hypothetical protein